MTATAPPMAPSKRLPGSVDSMTARASLGVRSGHAMRAMDAPERMATPRATEGGTPMAGAQSGNGARMGPQAVTRSASASSGSTSTGRNASVSAVMAGCHMRLPE